MEKYGVVQTEREKTAKLKVKEEFEKKAAAEKTNSKEKKDGKKE